MRILKIIKNVFVALLLLTIVNVQNNRLQATTHETELNQLFTQLSSASNQETALIAETQIWKIWFQSGNQEVDELMQEAIKRRSVFDFNGAIEVLSQIIIIQPNYAEAWNQRATAYFHQEKYEESLEDISKTLELEPRHFGALAGRAIIRLKQLKPVIARRNIEEAILLHPYLKERYYFPGLAK